MRCYVLMGVSGCGKSSVGTALSVLCGMDFVDGDDLHPQRNIEKMASGNPLDDEDRAPWLGEVGRTLARAKGQAPHLRMTAALSDGKRLYAIRYSTDDHAPTLYHRWSETRGGMAVVSEPLESDEGGWIAVPPYSFCVIDGERVEDYPFHPCKLQIAA